MSLNLSYECLTSFEVKQTLRDLHTTNGSLYQEFAALRIPNICITEENGELHEEDGQDNEDTFDDASDLDITALIGKMANTSCPNIIQDEDGDYISSYANDEVSLELPTTENDDGIEELGRGKRNKKLNQRFDKRFWMMH